MNRIEKIKLLDGIKEGSISKRVLLRPKSYVFTQKDEGEEILYEMGGKRYTQTEHDKFCDEIEIDNESLKALGLNELCIIVITIEYVNGKTIL
jgi:hypothetical protein